MVKKNEHFRNSLQRIIYRAINPTSDEILMQSSNLSLNILLAPSLNFSGNTLADNRGAQRSSAYPAPLTTPPGGIGGTGIIAGHLSIDHGYVIALGENNQLIQLADGDTIFAGDRIASSNDSKAKIQFTDGASLSLLNNTVIRIDDYYYSAHAPKQGRNLVTLAQGNIRSTSGTILKKNPNHYRLKTPVAIIRVIGTDFLVSHLPAIKQAVDAGTYTKVLVGKVCVQSASGPTHLHAGESSYVKLDGSQCKLTNSSQEPHELCTKCNF
jgi:hypothetical protein